MIVTKKSEFQSEIKLENLSLEEYQNFLNIKQLPCYQFNKGIFTINTEYLPLLGNGFKNEINTKNTFYSDLSPFLFDYQKFIVKVALLKRKFAIFSLTGTGKTLMLLEWLRKIRDKVIMGQKFLIISPLMIIEQSRQEQQKFYNYSDIINLHDYGFEKWLNSNSTTIGIVNYDYFRKEVDFKNKIGAVVCDESSIFKGDGPLKTNVINACKGIEWKLACTATPAPNDREEYANHALFLDQVRSAQEFFSRYFINRDNHWVLKPHSVEYFYKYLASFSIFLRSPAKYGFEDNAKDIPEPIIKKIDISLTRKQIDTINNKTDKSDLGLTISMNPGGIVERSKYSQISKGFLYSDKKRIITRIESNKPDIIVDIIKKYKDEQFIIWTNFDAEGEILLEKLKDVTSVVHVYGKTKENIRLKAIEDFKNGSLMGLITNPQMLGFGLNFQNCSVMVYSGLSDSMEKFFQSMRRAYRYGMTKQLKVFIPITKLEEAIYQNILRKAATMEEDASYQENLYIQKLAKELKEFADKEIAILVDNSEKCDMIKTSDYTLINGDNILELEKLEENSIDFCIFSPPFSSLFTYSSDIADQGNNSNDEEFCFNYKFFATRLLRVLKPGRKVVVHCMQLPILKAETGYSGMKDFRGLLIESMNSCGWETRGEVAVKKNQQMQSIIFHTPGLSMGGFKKDSNKSVPCFNDTCLIFSKPGENKIPVKAYENGEMTGDDWVNAAAGVWCDIKESDTLNSRIARIDEDAKHLCPMPLEIIRRFMKLYSNKGEVVLDPFNGVGSTGVIAMELGRKYLGLELKPEYFETSSEYIEAELQKRNRNSLGLLGVNK